MNFQKFSGGLTEPPPQTPPPLYLGLRPRFKLRSQFSGASRPRFGLRPQFAPSEILTWLRLCFRLYNSNITPLFVNTRLLLSINDVIVSIPIETPTWRRATASYGLPRLCTIFAFGNFLSRPSILFYILICSVM